MKHKPNMLACAAMPILSAAALLATPAFAQDATQTAPPPVTSTVPPAAPAPAPDIANPTPPPSAETGRPVANSATTPGSKTVIAPEAQAALDEAKAAARPARAAAPAPRAATRTVTRTTTTRTAAPAPAPVAETPAPAPEPAHVTEPVATTPPPAPVTEPAQAPVADTAATTTDQTATTTSEQRNTPMWPWLALAGVIVLAGLGFLLFRRRRDAIADQYAPESEPAYEPVQAVPEPVQAAPEPVVPPAYVPPVAAEAVAPSTPDDITVNEAEADEVAALTGAAPVGDRPWLEFAMRPIRAGTNVDEALVEIELTVANAGNVAAKDVRVSTFMLTEARANEMERLLVDPPADSGVEPVTIEPGEGTRIDATLAALKADFGAGEGFQPVVVADARYTLPDGSEGRTSASFMIGRSDAGGNLTPFDLSERQMHDDVEVRLHGTPQHA